jgi:MoaA/NifB/PqqE/SkfB family radical SAM enzyme
MSKSILASSPRFWAKVRGHNLHEKFITYMSLNQDSKCDAHCQGCFRYSNRREGLVNLLEVPDYIRLLDEFKRFGGLAIEISGEGEPLLPGSNALPIIRRASSLEIWTTLITNGHALTQAIAEELRDLRVALVVSLHSLKKEIYEGDNGCPNSFETTLDAIDMASRVFQGTSWRENGREIRRVCIHWTLQNNNLAEVSSAKKFCADKGLHFSIAPLANVGQALEHPEIQLPDGFANLQEINDLGDESIIFYDEPDGRVVCGTCKYGLNVGADGNLLLDAHGGYEVEIANVRELSFEQAVELQHKFSGKMFSQLNSFCPVRDPGWGDFLVGKKYI